MDNTKLQEVLSDEAFVKGLEEMKSEEELLAALKAKGVEITSEELRELANKAQEKGELNEDALENVAGGLTDPRIYDIPEEVRNSLNAIPKRDRDAILKKMLDNMTINPGADL